MKHSDSIVKLSAALSKAQAEMPSAPMNSVNPFLKNKFADLGAVINASRPVLAKNGLSITQFPVSDNGSIGVTSMLMHESGEWLEETITLPLNEEKGKSAAQVAGSVVTYLRRYSWSSMLGMYADEDTDGHQPEQPKKAQLPSAAKAEQPKSEPVSDATHDELMAEHGKLWHEASKKAGLLTKENVTAWSCKANDTNETIQRKIGLLKAALGGR